MFIANLSHKNIAMGGAAPAENVKLTTHAYAANASHQMIGWHVVKLTHHTHTTHHSSMSLGVFFRTTFPQNCEGDIYISINAMMKCCKRMYIFLRIFHRVFFQHIVEYK